jgi:hypothetical protein
MTTFGPFNCHQSAQQQSQRFHQEAAQRAREMHRQAQQRAQQPAQSPQWLRYVHERQHEQRLDNLKAGYWTEQQYCKQQVPRARQLASVQKRPPLSAGQPAGQVPQRLQCRPAQSSTVLQPQTPIPCLSQSRYTGLPDRDQLVICAKRHRAKMRSSAKATCR